MAVTPICCRWAITDGMRGAEVRSTQVFRHIGMTFRQALDVRFVDDGLLQRCARPAVVSPIERGVDHNGPWGRTASFGVGSNLLVGFGVILAVGYSAGFPVTSPCDGPGVRIDQQFRRVEPDPLLGVILAIDPQPVSSAGRDAIDPAVPDEVGSLGQAYRPARLAVAVRRTGKWPPTVACSEYTAKFAPDPARVAPSGAGAPGRTRAIGSGSVMEVELLLGWQCGSAGHHVRVHLVDMHGRADGTVSVPWEGASASRPSSLVVRVPASIGHVVQQAAPGSTRSTSDDAKELVLHHRMRPSPHRLASTSGRKFLASNLVANFVSHHVSPVARWRQPRPNSGQTTQPGEIACKKYAKASAHCHSRRMQTIRCG